MKIENIIEDNIEHMSWTTKGRFQFSQGAAIFIHAMLVESIPVGYMLTTALISKTPRPLLPGKSYKMTHLSNIVDSTAIVLEQEDGSRICLAIEDFLNAFSDNELPDGAPSTSLIQMAITQ